MFEVSGVKVWIISDIGSALKAANAGMFSSFITTGMLRRDRLAKHTGENRRNAKFISQKATLQIDGAPQYNW